MNGRLQEATIDARRQVLGRVADRSARRPIDEADGPPGSNLRSLRKYERVLDVHAEVPDGVFDLGVSK